jgi:hypothetical protein
MAQRSITYFAATLITGNNLATAHALCTLMTGSIRKKKKKKKKKILYVYGQPDIPRVYSRTFIVRHKIRTGQ